jgi:hypothetical protein
MLQAQAAAWNTGTARFPACATVPAAIAGCSRPTSSWTRRAAAAGWRTGLLRTAMTGPSCSGCPPLSTTPLRWCGAGGAWRICRSWERSRDAGVSVRALASSPGGSLRRTCRALLMHPQSDPACLRRAWSHRTSGKEPTFPVDLRRAGQGDRVLDVTDAVGRVRVTPPTTGSTTALQEHDFACAYEVVVAPGDNRSSEQWARAVWEGAPAPLRWFMLAGWRLVLGLRLGPRHSPDHILGWRIVDRGPDGTACQLRSGFLHAHNVFCKADGTFVWSTFVTYERPIGRVIWPPASLLHRLLVRIALRRAARP